MTKHAKPDPQRNEAGTGKTGRSRLLIAGGTLLLLLAGAVSLGLAGRAGNGGAAGKPEIRVLTAKTREVELLDGYDQTRRYLGRVEPFRTSRVGFERSGSIAKVLVREGERVTAGQPLARMDTRRLEAARSEAEAGLAEARAALRLARTTLERSDRARKLEALSEQQWDEARQNVDVMEARVARLEAQLERIDVDLEKSVIRAPFQGGVATRFLDDGTVANPGQPVLEIMETGNVEIRAGIDRDSAKGLNPGGEVEAMVEGRPVSLILHRILPGRSAATRTVSMIFVPSGPDPAIREGDLVEILIRERVEQPGYWLPVAAMTENARGLWSCYVAEPLDESERVSAATHRLTRRELEVIALEADRVFVTGSLEPGERVLVEGIHRIVPNQRIQIQKSSPSGPPAEVVSLTTMLAR